eukprot:3077716-Alexandrium_andersonii.AAC.1
MSARDEFGSPRRRSSEERRCHRLPDALDEYKKCEPKAFLSAKKRGAERACALPSLAEELA